MFGVKPLYIRFDTLDSFIRVYDVSRYLVSFGPEKYDAIYNMIKYLQVKKLVLRLLSLLQNANLTIEEEYWRKYDVNISEK